MAGGVPASVQQLLTLEAALLYRNDIDDDVANSAAQDALGRLQDFVADFAPDLKQDVLDLRRRHNRWRASQRTGADAGESIKAIRAAILDLTDQTYEEARRRAPQKPRLVIDNDRPALAQIAAIADMAPPSDAPPPDASPEPLIAPPPDIHDTAADERVRRRVLRELRATDAYLACACKDVTRRYQKGAFELQPVSLELRAGEITGVVGRNASGKTTLLRLMMGDLKPDAGTIRYPSLTRDGDSWQHIKNQIAYVAQSPERWHGSLRNNLNFVAAANARKGDNVQEIVDWTVARYDLDRFADASWDEISGGYKTRFELARALVSQPKILFLDEPLAFLDVIARQRFLMDLKTIANSITNPVPIVITSQHLNEIEAIADHMVLLDDGKCVYAGPIEGIGELSKDRRVEISLRATRANLDTALAGLGLRGVETTMEGYLLNFPKAVDLGAVVQRLHAAFGAEFSAFRDITNSARSLMSEDVR